MYGSKVYVRVPEEKRVSKWDKKAEMGILLGYTDVGYRVLINNRVVIARHVDIIKEDVKLIAFDDNEEDNNIDEEKWEDSLDRIETEDMVPYNNVSKEIVNNEKRTSKRQIKAPHRFDEEFGYYCITANYCDAMIPDTFQEATTCDEADEWKEAMDREMNSLVKNDTWTLVNAPQEKESSLRPSSLEPSHILSVFWPCSKEPQSEPCLWQRLHLRGLGARQPLGPRLPLVDTRLMSFPRTQAI
ncbi:hypothetical protein MSG28_006546 [Choristoneura fumiferana]|uniref:Uncharacterized protein n=1 Tax=Choristoneura fumiferana TaxID=7141 RepID=A0ACC0JFA3_CHOFU|nr:hypothetical protein MSG28_006546 [Choristoneura fumiferana]